jgi:hypothetical protein
MHKKTRPVFKVGRELDAIANLGAHLEGWAQTLSRGQVAALGREIAEMARAARQQLWAWDDPKGELFGEPDCREMLYRIQRLEETPRLYPLKKL